MTDEELAKFLCITDDARWPKVIENLTPEQRATFERMAELEIEIKLWMEGVGPKPTGVLMDFDRKAFR